MIDARDATCKKAKPGTYSGGGVSGLRTQDSVQWRCGTVPGFLYDVQYTYVAYLIRYAEYRYGVQHYVLGNCQNRVIY